MAKKDFEWWTNTSRMVVFSVGAAFLFGVVGAGALATPRIDAALAGALTVAASACVVAAYFDKFDKMKFGLSGVEAERARQIVDEAAAKAEELRELAFVFVKNSIETGLAGMWVDDKLIAEGQARKARLLDMLARMGVDPAKIEEARDADRNTLLLTLASNITNAIFNGGGAECQRAATGENQRMYDGGDPLPVAHYRAIAERLGLLGDARITEALTQYQRCYDRQGEIAVSSPRS